MNWLEFECMIMDLCDENNIKTTEGLQRLSEFFHEHIEIALMDYAYDNKIEDYEPNY